GREVKPRPLSRAEDAGCCPRMKACLYSVPGLNAPSAFLHHRPPARDEGARHQKLGASAGRQSTGHANDVAALQEPVALACQLLQASKSRALRIPSHADPFCSRHRFSTCDSADAFSKVIEEMIEGGELHRLEQGRPEACGFGLRLVLGARDAS